MKQGQLVDEFPAADVSHQDLERIYLEHMWIHDGAHGYDRHHYTERSHRNGSRWPFPAVIGLRKLSRLLRSSLGYSRRSKSNMNAKKPRRVPRRSGKAKEKRISCSRPLWHPCFAPAAMTTAIDPGVSNFLGRSIKIEAHKRNHRPTHARRTQVQITS